MSLNLSKPKIAIIASAAFVGGVMFASSMDWTKIVGAQIRGTSGKPLAKVSSSLMDQQNSFVAIAEHVTPAVVSIDAQTDARKATRSPQMRNLPPGFEQFFDDPRQQERGSEATGTGFIVSSDGYVLTNNHVVEGADRVTVGLSDRRSFKAKVIGTDPQTDVAVLKIDGKDLPTIALGDDSKVRVGEWAVAIGNPLGLDFTVTAGIISAKGRSNELRGLNNNVYAIQDFLQTDAAINPGNSGGPLVNLRGEVVGINSAIASQTGTYSGYGFAIPINLAKTVMDDIIAHGRVRRAIMGVRIQEITAEDAQVNGLKEIAGVKIGDFQGVENSPAEKAGLQPGDVIVKADGKPVDRVSTLQRIVRTHQPGETVELEGVRYGKKQMFKIKLMEAEGEKATVASAVKEKDAPSTGSASTTVVKKLGITVTAPPVELLRAAKSEVFGAFVKEVERGGAAAATRAIGVGDVITEVVFPQKTVIKTVADLQKVISGLKEGDYIGVKIARYNSDGTVGQTGIVNLRVGGN